MSKQQFNEQAQNIIERGKEVVAEGKQRHLIVRKQDGTQLFATNLTVAAGVGIVLLVMGWLTLPFILIATAVVYMSKIKVEMQHDA